jgi:hypothetical protein
MKPLHEIVRDVCILAVCVCLCWFICMIGMPARQLVSDADLLVKHSDALVVSVGSDIAETNKALLALAEHALSAVDGAAAMTQDLSQITAKLASPPPELKGKKPLSFGDRLIRLIF